MDRPDVLTVEEVADWLRIGVKTAYRLAQRGELPSMKIGRVLRFRRVDVEAHLERLAATKGEAGVTDDGDGDGDGPAPVARAPGERPRPASPTPGAPPSAAQRLAALTGAEILALGPNEVLAYTCACPVELDAAIRRAEAESKAAKGTGGGRR